jgi:hypothetical protein
VGLALGIDDGTQVKRLRHDRFFRRHLCERHMAATLMPRGGTRWDETPGIDLDYLPMWLAALRRRTPARCIVMASQPGRPGGGLGMVPVAQRARADPHPTGPRQFRYRPGGWPPGGSVGRGPDPL